MVGGGVVVKVHGAGSRGVGYGGWCGCDGDDGGVGGGEDGGGVDNHVDGASVGVGGGAGLRWMWSVGAGLVGMRGPLLFGGDTPFFVTPPLFLTNSHSLSHSLSLNLSLTHCREASRKPPTSLDDL